MKLALKKPLALILSLVVLFSAAAVGSFAAIPNIPTWYASLDKPFFTPPNWVFGPMWTLLYISMAITFYLVLMSHSPKGNTKEKRDAYTAFGAQLVLNSLWTVTFFGLHLIDAAVAVILLLLVTIVATMFKMFPFSKPAVWLLVPYLVWVMFAAYLNIGIASLN